MLEKLPIITSFVRFGSQVDKLKQQADEQESELKTQEDELFSKKSELDKLRGEECRLEEAVAVQRARRDAQVKELAETRLELARLKHDVDCLQSDSDRLDSAVKKFDAALEANDVLALNEAALEDIAANLTSKEDEEVQGALGSATSPELNVSVHSIATCAVFQRKMKRDSKI